MIGLGIFGESWSVSNETGIVGRDYSMGGSNDSVSVHDDDDHHIELW